MKTAMIARFVLGAGAIFAVAGLAGCGAEQGSDGSEGIGVTSEKIVASTGTTYDSVKDVHNSNAAIARAFAAGCTIRDAHTNKDLLLQLGGVDTTGAPTRDWVLFDPSGTAGQNPTQQWIDSGTFGSSGDERAYAKAIQLPGALSSCVLVGGLKTASSPLTTFKFTYDSSATPKMTITGVGSLPSAQGAMALHPCGSKLIAFGGATLLSSLLPATPTNAISVWDGSAWHAASLSSVAKTLTVSRFDFGSIKDPSGDNFIAVGGDTGGAESGRIEFIKVTNTCDYDHVSVTTLAAGARTTSLHPPVRGNVLVEQGTANTVISAGGWDSSTATTNTEKLLLNWGTATVTTITDAADDMPTAGTHSPTLVVAPISGVNHYVLIGGDSTGSLTTTLATVNEYVPGTGWSTQISITGQRAGAPAAFLPSRHTAGSPALDYIYVSSGYDSSPGTHEVSTVREISVH